MVVTTETAVGSDVTERVVDDLRDLEMGELYHLAQMR